MGKTQWHGARKLLQLGCARSRARCNDDTSGTETMQDLGDIVIERNLLSVSVHIQLSGCAEKMWKSVLVPDTVDSISVALQRCYPPCSEFRS